LQIKNYMPINNERFRGYIKNMKKSMESIILLKNYEKCLTD
jgi:hypothetical protein